MKWRCKGSGFQGNGKGIMKKSDFGALKSHPPAPIYLNKTSEILCVCLISHSLQDWGHIQRQIDNVVFNFQVAIVEHKCRWKVFGILFYALFQRDERKTFAALHFYGRYVVSVGGFPRSIAHFFPFTQLIINLSFHILNFTFLRFTNIWIFTFLSFNLTQKHTFLSLTKYKIRTFWFFFEGQPHYSLSLPQISKP